MNPKISIITPSYNQGQFIEETILSVRNQDYPNIEHIIIDGGSVDATVNILKKYEKDIKWVSEPDNGQTHAINKGLRKASGEVLAWLNSDDLYLPDAISTVVNYYKKYPEYDFFFGDLQVISPEGKKLLITKECGFDKGIMFFGGNPFGQPSTFFSKRMVERIGYLDESLNWSMDYEYWLRAAHKGIQFKQIKEVLSKFRYHQTSKTISSHSAIMKEHLEVLNRYRKFKMNNSPRIDYLFVKTLKYFYRLKKVCLRVIQRRQFAPFACKLMMIKHKK